jgi:signal transduction histidine kinase
VFARSGAWWVQPFADQPFTSIGPDSRWKSRTHSGTEYAALLVEPGYEPPATMDALPSAHGAVVALAVTEGAPVFWRTARFQLSCVLACALALLVFYRWRLHQLTRQLNLRFEERLAERTRIARELHDTLLQGFLSASMQLHVAVEQVPADSPARPGLGEPSS